MKSIVVYDSNFGNTRLLAEIIATEIAGKAFSVDDITHGDLKGVDLLIVGSPINGWRPTAKMTGFLNSLKESSLSKMKAAAFDSRIRILISGNAAKRISKILTEKGASVISQPKGFYVISTKGPIADGEIAGARQWAKGIFQKATNGTVIGSA